METPAEIDYVGDGASPEIREAVDAHIAALEKRFGRITSCRVVIKPPTSHHRTGGHFHVNIHLVLPNGRTVDVGRTANNDGRFSDLKLALNVAFKRARRQLQEHVRRMRGNVKTHEPEPLGTVTSIDEPGGFGFLEAPDGREIYFHRNSVLQNAFADLKVGTRVAFFEEEGNDGPQASTVRIAGKHGLR